VRIFKKSKPFGTSVRFLWQITQNHVNDENTVIHEHCFYIIYVILSDLPFLKNLREKMVALEIEGLLKYM
jgi:hypothetical protein